MPQIKWPSSWVSSCWLLGSSSLPSVYGATGSSCRALRGLFFLLIWRLLYSSCARSARFGMNQNQVFTMKRIMWELLSKRSFLNQNWYRCSTSGLKSIKLYSYSVFHTGYCSSKWFTAEQHQESEQERGRNKWKFNLRLKNSELIIFSTTQLIIYSLRVKRTKAQLIRALSGDLIFYLAQ